ncbi:Tight junction protein ZO-1 [Cichlidogyrus casuarinus]|uniref:Tight junction protein ZO-1 n=1 Tax=Cichlidogyrus casuarinus TaxID=1844966 RepID=A0ABD2PPH1_9PLAT
MKRQVHSLLDILPSAVERLLVLGINPIVILITPESYDEVKIALNFYRNSIQPVESQGDIMLPLTLDKSENVKDLAKQIWSEFTTIQQNFLHLITETIPMPSGPRRGQSIHDFKQLEGQWMSNLLQTIGRVQKQSVWVGEESSVGIEFTAAQAAKEQQEKRAKLLDKLLDVDDAVPELHYQNVPLEAPQEYRNGFDDLIPESLKNLRKATYESMKEREEMQQVKSSQEEQWQEAPQPKKKDLYVETTTTEKLNSYPSFEVVEMEPIEEEAEEDKVDGGKRWPSVQELKKSFSTPHVRARTTTPYKRKFGPSPLDKDIFTAQSSRSGYQASPISSFAEDKPKKILAECSGFFDHQGGDLSLPDHNVFLHIPPNAIPVSSKKTFIFLRIYQDFESNCSKSMLNLANNEMGEHSHIVSPMVMCGPRGQIFDCPVELVMPRYQNEHRRSEEAILSGKWSTTLLHGTTEGEKSNAERSTSPDFIRAPHIWHEVRYLIISLSTNVIRKHLK